MASSGKRKTTMAKLNRESKLRDKRAVKAARKDARKRAAEDGTVEFRDAFTGELLTSDDPVTH
jgi:hypothetical protein